MTDLRKAAEMMAFEVPLHELLEGVPEDARLVIDSEDGMSTRFIPVGHLCKRAAEALRQALAESANFTTDFVEPKAASQTEQKMRIEGSGTLTTKPYPDRYESEKEFRQALAQPVDLSIVAEVGVWGEKPPVKTYCGGKPNYCTPEVTGEVGACVTCGAPKSEWLVDDVNMSQERVDETAKREHEPVWSDIVSDGGLDPRNAFDIAPPKREWVGLTDEDLEPMCDDWRIVFGPYVHDFSKAIESKLKEKNA